MDQVLAIGLQHGLALCGWMGALIVASLRHDPRIWQSDAPRAIRDMLGPVSEATRRRRSAWGVVMLVGLVVVYGGLVARLGDSTFAERFVAALIAFEVFNLFDALVIDVALLLVWAPAWAFAPGVRHHPALRDPRFHLRNFGIGAIGGLPFAALVAALGYLAG